MFSTKDVVTTTIFCQGRHSLFSSRVPYTPNNATRALRFMFPESSTSSHISNILLLWYPHHVRAMYCKAYVVIPISSISCKVLCFLTMDCKAYIYIMIMKHCIRCYFSNYVLKNIYIVGIYSLPKKNETIEAFHSNVSVTSSSSSPDNGHPLQ